MLTQEQLIAYYEHQLAPPAREEFEQLLANEPEAQLSLADQENIDLALRVCLGKAEAHERVKQSIFTVLRGASVSELTAQVMEETRAKQATETTAKIDQGAALWVRVWRFGALTLQRLHASTFQQRIAYAAGVAAIITVALSAWLFFRPASIAPVTIGQFAVVVGQPTLQHGAGRSTLNPQLSTPIHLGDRLETGDADKAEIVFKDGTTLRLGFNTLVEFPTLNSQLSTPNSPLSRPPETNLRRGQVWTKIQKSTNAPQYAIRTEAATAVARGTEFGVKIQRAASTNSSTPTTVLTVKEGAVDFSNALGSVQATAMTESTATPDRSPSQPVLLKTVREFVVSPSKKITFEAQLSVIDLHKSTLRMVYPQGWAGFDVRAIQDTQNTALRQLRIVRIWPGSPAEQAGLAVGDVITRVNDQPVTQLQEILRPIFQQPGASVTLSFSRNELPRTVSLVTTNDPHAVPTGEMAPDLAGDLYAVTWPLIEAGCQDVISRNQWRELGQELRKVLDRYPDAAAVHNNLGVWYEANQEVGPAIQQLQQAIAREPNNPLYHYNLSKVLVSIGNFERSAEEAEAVVAIAPHWERGIAHIGEVYSFLGRYNDALAALERGLSVSPSCAALWHVKTSVLLYSQKLDEALTAALKAVELEPLNADRFLQLALVYWTRGQREEGEAASRKAIEIDPGYPEAYNSLAVDFIGRLGGRLPEDPTDAPPDELAIDRWRDRPAGELAVIAEAERLSRKAVELNPNGASSSVNLGNILLLRGAVDEAELILRKAAELDPNGQAASAYNSLAYRFAGWGIRLDEALQLAQRAVQLAPEGWAFDTLATVHFRRGEWDQAEAAWKKCLELAGTPSDPAAWFHLGKVYERKNQISDAIAAYQEALRLRPNYPEATRALDKIRR